MCEVKAEYAVKETGDENECVQQGRRLKRNQIYLWKQKIEVRSLAFFSFF